MPFANRTRLEAELRNNWERACAVLESVLPQALQDAVYTALCPPLTDAAKRAELETMAAKAAYIGDAALITSIDAAKATLPAAEPKPVAPAPKG